MEKLSNYIFSSASDCFYTLPEEAQGWEKGHLGISSASGRAGAHLLGREENPAGT